MPPPRGRWSRLASVVAAAAAMVIVSAGCTSGDDPRAQRLAPRPSTTTLLLEDGVDLPAPLPGTPPEELRAALGAAVDARDTCALAAAMDEVIPDVDDPDAVLDAYRELLESVRRAESFRPEELADAWGELVAGVDAGVEALADAEGDLEDPAVTATFTADALQGAVRTVQRWAELNCAAG